jgi:hypothetical protein
MRDRSVNAAVTDASTGVRRVPLRTRPELPTSEPTLLRFCISDIGTVVTLCGWR